MDSDKVDPDECTASGEPKACADCNTTRTPLWRGGPTGPKSLCNACGIRYRKKRRQALGLDTEVKKKPKKEDITTKPTAAAAAHHDHHQGEGDGEGERAHHANTMELHMVGFAKDVVLKQRRRMRRRKPSCLGEEERAAILLMALSSGVIYA